MIFFYFTSDVTSNFVDLTQSADPRLIQSENKTKSKTKSETKIEDKTNDKSEEKTQLKTKL